MKFVFAFHQASQNVYALGGSTRIRLLTILKTVHVYRRNKNIWERRPELHDSESNAGACFVNSKLYYFYTAGRRTSMHQIAMRFDIFSSRPSWEIIGVTVNSPRMPTRHEAYRLPGLNEICVEDSRKKVSRLIILNKKGNIAHYEDREIVQEQLNLRKMFFKRRGNSLFRICKSHLYEFDRKLKIFKSLPVTNYKQ